MWILFPVMTEVKSCFLFVLKLSRLDCFYYSNQYVYLDMCMSGTLRHFHTCNSILLFVWNQGDIAGERLQLTKLDSRRGRPGSKESVLMKQSVCSHHRMSMCMYFETTEKHTEEIEITFLTTQRELFLTCSTRIKIYHCICVVCHL